ncbi:MFS transporter [Streptomyces sp. KAU_LT]|uniref:MFS transporter n=1 Tax=Streptomyces sp. KAU_LT TaxID=3046669 RepID=UPI0024B70636|nr:MFS transporter [Streptomyces sp. KAU_LT]MDI9835136.1 MFS transporter [Streptomyces sp. KAU_LT]
MTSTAELGVVTTKVPARLDRLPWSRFHWRIVIGLGTVWILDGLEVTIVGAVAARMTEPGSGINLTSADIGTAAAIYVAGACVGALLFGRLTDRYGRKKLFMLTLGIYILATVATAFAHDAWFLYLARFVTGMGIGGEYAAINSAIDELIPARNRGQVDLAINGSYWVGAALGSLVAVLLLNENLLADDLGWRLAFGLGGVLGLGIMLVRRHVPESPRWLFIHGREEEAERIVDRIEAEVRQETDRELPEPGEAVTVRQRDVIPFKEIAGVAVRRYPRRAVLGLALFVGQAFLYNAIVFDLGTILNGFFDIGSGSIPYFMAIFAIANFLGPLLLGRLFDTVGRKPMIASTYFGSAVVAVVLAVLLVNGSLTAWWFFLLVSLTFFVASAGASSAYLTVSEVFPMETRALSISLFFAIGTAVGGITGPLLFGHLIHSGDTDLVAIGFIVGAAAMALGGLAEVVYGVRAEQQSLENIARPLTAEEADAAWRDESASPEARERRPEPARQAVDERDQRIADRTARRRERERAGARRYRPGTGQGSRMYSPGMAGTAGTASRTSAMAERRLDEEVEQITHALRESGPTSRDQLEQAVDGRSWGPGRFRRALRESERESRAKSLGGGGYAPADGTGRPDSTPDGPEDRR